MSEQPDTVPAVPPGARAPAQHDLLAALRRPEAYPVRPTAPVEVLETHISLLFFADDRVYKVKKGVDLGFLDHSTLEKRRAACREEVRLNSRLAPDVYLRTVPITREADGRLVFDGDGDVVEVAVEMRRLPAERMLDRLLDAGHIDNEIVRSLAEMLALFHLWAPTGPDVNEHGAPTAVRRVVLDNLAALQPFVGGPGEEAASGLAVLPRRVHAFLRARLEAFLDKHAGLLAARVDDGRVREGHGDLHAGNLCLTADGPVAYDCIEFSRRLRCGDTANDLAFLAMDLDSRGYRAFARQLVREYARIARDGEVGYLLGFYKTHRALVRALVAALTARQRGPGDPERERWRRRAMASVQLAASYELPPCLILTCGLPGTGKSWWAQRLARPFEACVLRSDVVRKQLHGFNPTSHPSGEAARQLYAPAVTDEVYRQLLRRAGDALACGRSVVVDAAFCRRAERRRFVDVAGRLGCPVVVVHVTAPEETVRARLLRRTGDPLEVSDADFAVHEQLRAGFEPPDELLPACRLQAPDGRDADELLLELMDRLVQQVTSAPGGERTPPSGKCPRRPPLETLA